MQPVVRKKAAVGNLNILEAPPPEPAHAPRFKDRVIELRRVKASELLDNPKNWRRHPDEQVGAMTSMMDRIGVAAAAIGVVKEGHIELLDGHLRKGIAGDEVIPVLIVDLNEEEQKVFLASYDKLAELALGDPKQLHDLLSEFQFPDEDAFFRKLMSDVEDELAVEVKQSGAAQKEIEGMELQPHEHYDFLVVMAQTTHEWNVLCDRLGLKPETRRKGMGTARAIRATRVLEKLNDKR